MNQYFIMSVREVSFEDFMEQLKKDSYFPGREEFVKELMSTRNWVPRRVEKDNEDVLDELSENIFYFKPAIRQRELMLPPKEAQNELRKLLVNQGRSERFMDVLFGVREEPVKVTKIVPGHRMDRRDWVIKGVNPKTGENAPDYRVLVEGERGERGIYNEASMAPTCS